MNISNQKKEGMLTRALFHRCLAIILLLALTTMLSIPTLAAAHEQIPVTLAGQPLGEPAYLIDGVTYVPFRALCSIADNCKVSWDNQTKTARATTARGATVSARVGEEIIELGARVFFTAAPNRIVNDRLYVAVRPLAKCFGIEVSWHAARRAVSLKKTGQAPRHDAGVYDADALYWLSRIIAAEAKGEPFRGQLAVGNVVLNRVESSAYPNSVYGVVFDKKHGVQFSPTANGTIYAAPTADATRAAKACLEGYTLSDRILYFFNPRLAQSAWIAQNCTYAFRIGSHVFYL